LLRIQYTPAGKYSDVALMAGQLGGTLEASAGVLQSLFGIETGEKFPIDIR